ncbi:MAG: hypothetical protein K5990_03405 [Oscillospiraceae bacterium]|nr:hypothetical protein [Oscillospiraceae bacterium]
MSRRTAHTKKRRRIPQRRKQLPESLDPQDSNQREQVQQRREQLQDQFNPVGSDKDVSHSIRQIAERDEEYTELLKAYVDISKTRIEKKEIYKWRFFWMVISACIVLFVVAVTTICFVLVSEHTERIASAVPVIVTAFASLVSAVIGIPLAITNFLFNTKEDDNITEIIKHTQEHDAAGRNLFKDDIAKRS